MSAASRGSLRVLAGEEGYCQHNRPEYFETSLGMPSEGEPSSLDDPDPIHVPLPDGKAFRARGRIDRIDRIGDGASHNYAVWDYKTGSTYRYRSIKGKDPFVQGRLVQYVLYLAMAESVLRHKVDAKADVQQAGYYFPTGRGQGERIVRTREQLAGAGQVIEHLCRIVANGAFLATNNSDGDCDYCDYKLICHDPKATAAASQRKLASGRNEALKPMRELRSNG